METGIAEERFARPATEDPNLVLRDPRRGECGRPSDAKGMSVERWLAREGRGQYVFDARAGKEGTVREGEEGTITRWVNRVEGGDGSEWTDRGWLRKKEDFGTGSKLVGFGGW